MKSSTQLTLVFGAAACVAVGFIAGRSKATASAQPAPSQPASPTIPTSPGQAVLPPGWNPFPAAQQTAPPVVAGWTDMWRS